MQAAVLAYVRNGTDEEKQTILKQGTVRFQTVLNPMVVYRGQPRSFGDPSKMPLFSATLDADQAKSEFAGDEGCVWTITLRPGVRYLDVQAVLAGATDLTQEDRDMIAREKEILVLGEGTMEGSLSSAKPCTYTATYTAGQDRAPAIPPGLLAPAKTPASRPGVLAGGRQRRRTRRWKMPRKMSRNYCRKTPCRKMGFTQRASCRPYKNCFTRRTG